MNLTNFAIIQKIRIHIPFNLLRERYLPLVIESRLQPEIGFSYKTFDHYKASDFVEIGKHLSAAGLNATLHAPFHDLRPGALDHKIRQQTMDRLKQVFDLVPYYHPVSIVCHPAFDAKYYVSAEREWLENSLDTWRHFLSSIEGTNTMIALENVYEENPQHLKEIFSAVDSPQLRFCFDTGHFNAFSRAPLETWMKEMSGWLSEVHIHDNDGSTDAHLALGEGTFPFLKFFQDLHDSDLHPIITVEAHSEKTLLKTLGHIETMGLSQLIQPPSS